ncbi:MAG: PAS domain S-box protein [Deltaproteobacteria bacterium]|jgi:PAS domain S-box-containing protein|nr:PAS domain S-box protein [Deltaproteobacteria bacterium]
MAPRPNCDTLEKRIRKLEEELQRCSQADKSMGEGEDTARALLNATSESAILIDAKGIILAVNEVAVQMLGKLNVNIIRTNIRDVFPTDVAQRINRKIDAVIDSGEPIQFEYESDRLIYANTVYPIFERHGSIEKLALYTRDITDQRRAIEALRESEEKFRSISSSAQDALIMMNSRGNISYWNEAAERIFGYTKKEAINRNLHKLLVPQKYHEAFTKGFKGFKETGQGSAIGKTLEMSALRKDGREFFMELSLSSFQLQGQWHALGVVRDVSDRNQAEKERLQKEKLEGVLEMAGAACHELNQPLQIMFGYNELLIKDIPDDHPLFAKLNIIREQIEKMRVITKKIMKITKYETKPYAQGSIIIDIDKSSDTIK